ncbi:MAG: carboxypeptidase-like regulatory domain-containing protein [Flavisolibacter sp.]
MCKRLSFSALLIFFLFRAVAQENENILISYEFQNSTLSQLAAVIESKTPFHFYYDSSEVDSIRINLSVHEMTTPRILDQALKNTDVFYSIDRNKNIFITKKIRLLTQLQEGFYKKEIIGDGSGETRSLLNRIEKTKTIKSGSDNKIYEIGPHSNLDAKAYYILTGYIRNAKNGEAVINATLFSENQQKGLNTDQYGRYSLTIAAGKQVLEVQAIGMKDGKFQVIVNGDGRLDIELAEQVNTLKTVVVSTRKKANINGLQLGIEHLNIIRIKKIPAAFGESDVLRAVTTLPGVKSVGEASTGFNVRGGSADQNLVLFNEGTIYNPSHFFGLFSAFNPDIIKDIQLYKSSIPARYGGRLSSVLDIITREGNNKKVTGSAGIGLITSRFNIEGPIVKNKTSFLFGGRSSYSNWLMQFLPEDIKESRASFYDANLTISHHLNLKNDLYITSYISNDKFNLSKDTTYQYSNKDVSLKWKHSFSNKLVTVFTAGFDQYLYNIKSQRNKVNAYKLSFDINQANFKADFNYYINSQHSLNFGSSTIHYLLHSGSFTPIGDQSRVAPDIIPAEQALESAVYISDKFSVNNKLSVEGGLRYSIFNYLGPKSVNIYASGLPIEDVNLLQTHNYPKGAFIKTYSAPEYRMSLRYAFTTNFSIKAGYNSLNQYIHMLTNTTAISPTDIWKLSDPNIKPQQGDQISLGFYKNLRSNSIETSVEVYYKKINNYLDYKPGATLLLNHSIEQEIIETKGRGYGLEFMVKKEEGKLNGWISYTYSRILLKSTDPLLGTLVNNGNEYPANYDIPHSLNLVGNFTVNHRFSVSVNSNYSTGRPITLPVGVYYYAGSQRVLYLGRNQNRIPDYFRTDLSLNIDGNHKVKQLTHNSWTIGVYNLTGRKNPYSIYFISQDGIINGYKLSIFGSILPFVNYNIRF